jgi:hypothetical protein
MRAVLRKPGSGIGTGFGRPEQPEQPEQPPRFSIFEIGMAAQVCIDLSLPVCLSAALGGRIYSYIHQASRPLIFRLFRRGGDDDLFRRNLNIFFAKPLTRPRWPTFVRWPTVINSNTSPNTPLRTRAAPGNHASIPGWRSSS